jgi:hypothetical protein
MSINIINSNSRGRIKYVLRNKKYFFCVFDDNYLIIDVNSLDILYRVSSKEEEKTMVYINKNYKFKFRHNVTYEELVLIRDIPEIKRAGKLTDLKGEAILEKQLNPFLNFKVQCIKFVDLYNVRNLEGKKLECLFEKLDEFTIRMFFSNESEGNKNEIFCSFKAIESGKKYKHYYNGVLEQQSSILDDLFK